MNKHRLHLHHPGHPREVHAVLPTAAGKPNHFTALGGKGQYVEGLVAALLDHGNKQKPLPATIVKKGFLWVATFSLPPELPKETYYHLFVGQTGATAEQGGNRGVSIDFKLLPPAPPPGKDDTILVQYPGDNATVGNSFVACGSDAPTTNGHSGAPTNADMQIDWGSGFATIASGAKIDTGVGGVWMFQFTNVPDNQGYRIYVYNDSDKGRRTGITVDGNSAPSIIAPDPPTPPGP